MSCLPDNERFDLASPHVCSSIDNIRETADFYYRLTQNETISVSGLGDRYYTQSATEFFAERKLPIPQELLSEMDRMSSHMTMGLFPEIRRAYVTIDCDIYLWSYDNDSDLAVFDGVPNTVLRLCLAKPRPNVFQGEIQCVLMVGTVADLLLYGMREVAGEGISLIPQPFFKVSLDGGVIGPIVSTDNGRIFFTIKNTLSEFVYQNAKGWRRAASCQRVDRSTSLFDSLCSYIIPITDEIEEVVVDESRHILFTLTHENAIQVFDLGSSGEDCSKLCTVEGNRIIAEATNLTGGQHESSFFSHIVTISAVPATESRFFNLVAVTTKGVRMYFSCLPRPSQPANAAHGQYLQIASSVMCESECRPVQLRLVHVRFPPPGICPPSLFPDARRGVYAAHLNSSLCAVTATKSDTVWATSDLYTPSSRFFTETSSEVQVEGNIWAMWSGREALMKAPRPGSGMIAALEAHSFHSLHSHLPQRLMLLTDMALHVICHRSPLDALREALSQTVGYESAETSRLCFFLGALDTLVLSLSIICSPAAVDAPLREKALRLFFGWKDETEMIDPDSARQQWSARDASIAEWHHGIGSPVMASTPHGSMLSPGMGGSGWLQSPMSASFSQGGNLFQWKPSKRHDALYAYFSRLVYPLWNVSLASCQNDQVLETIDSQSLEWLGVELRRFSEAIMKYNLVPRPKAFPAGPSDLPSASIHNTMNSEAASRERDSLAALHALVTRTAETLSLWATAVSHSLPAVTANLRPEEKDQLVHTRLSQLATQTGLSSLLIRALIQYFLGDEAGTRDLNARLRNACPSLYSKEDALVTNALELLERASKGGGPNTRLISQAVELLKQSCTKLALPDVTEKLVELKAYDSAVELCLLKAERVDPKQLALIAYTNGRLQGDREVAEAVAKRNAAYSVITGMLNKLQQTARDSMEQRVSTDSVIRAVLESKDELGHATLFSWMMEKGRSSAIIDSGSPFVEQWLNHEIARGGGMAYMDVMWRWYEKNNMLGKAARLLNRLADSEGNEVRLENRLSYLSHGILCAQSSKGTEQDGTELISDMRDKLEVAHIQSSIKNALEGSPLEGSSAAAARLSGKILALQDLLFHYAVPFRLAKIQLDIFRCANLYNEEKILNVWKQIIQQEFSRPGNPDESKILHSFADLAARFAPSNYFPTELILLTVVGKAFESGIPPIFFVPFTSKIGVSLSQALQILSDEYRNGDPFWRENGRGCEFIIDVAVTLVEDFLASAIRYTQQQRSSLTSKCEAALSAFAIDARSLHASSTISSHLQQRLATCHARLSHFSS